tara:strand:+ start:46261 stop:47238 length:978 start_codon:yes stop_codon:yes gene_type:complete
MAIGDPEKSPHPVVAMGWLINHIRNFVESIAKDNKSKLKVGGFFISFLLILTSGFSGWCVERLATTEDPYISILGKILLLIGLSSSIAYKSLKKSVIDVLNAIPNEPESATKNIKFARNKLSKIVGRDVQNLNKEEILRATAESASENSVDGVFAPIFWMTIGGIFWHASINLPGPLSFAFIFKASSTIDSMVGYKIGRLRWLGYSGAKLDDFLTWIPCRLVLISLPIVSRPWRLAPELIKSAWEDGSKDQSPNSGLSEAIFAHCLRIRMGGENIYHGNKTIKVVLAENEPEASKESIIKLLNAIFRLELLWILIILFFKQLNII